MNSARLGGLTPSVHLDQGLLHVDRFNAGAWGYLELCRTLCMTFLGVGKMATIRCSRISGVAWITVAFVIGIVNAVSEAQTKNAPALLLPTRSISLKTCGWELEHQLFVHSTGYVPLSLAFDHQGNLWTGYTTNYSNWFRVQSQSLVSNTTLWSCQVLRRSALYGLNRPTTVSSPVAILFSNKGNMLAVANDQLHLIDQNGFKDQAVFDLLRPSDHEYYRLSQSPGRKSLVVVIDGHVTAESSYTWLDLDTLNIIHPLHLPSCP